MKYPVLAIIGLTTMAGCVDNTSAAPDPAAIGMANPASVYCIEQGGSLEIRQSTEGEVGICHLPDGTWVEEWQFFRANHKT
jgi:uncharacterized protein